MTVRSWKSRTRHPDEADVVWQLDMMNKLGVSQHNMCSCSVTAVGDLLFVNTSNGVDEEHINLPRLDAPSFIACGKNTGKVLWTDNSPGRNMLHGQWSSPAYAVLGGVPQVIFGGGDGWLYSFAAEGENGKPELLWKFDCNPKESKYVLGGRATRNHIIGTPVIYDGLVYVGVGEDPEHGEGVGHLWCIDPTKRGDVSPTIVLQREDLTKPIAPEACRPWTSKEGRCGPRQSQLGRRLALRRRRTQRQDRVRRDDAPHLRHRGHQGRPAVRRRLQRPVPLPGRQDRQGRTGRTTCWPPPGARR